MEFDFSKLQEMASDLAQKAVQGVSYVAQKGKEKYDRFTLETQLGKEQRQLGAYYYNQVKMGADHAAAMAECVDHIDLILSTLNDLEDKNEAKEPQPPVCPNCGTKLEEGALFCSQCGTKL